MEQLDVPVDLGAWTTVRLVLEGDTGELIINGKTVDSETVTIDPDDIASAIEVSDKTAAYRLGADNNNKNCLNGSMDYVHLYNGRTSNPANVNYTEREEINNNHDLLGDVDFNGSLNVFDLIILKRMYIKNKQVPVSDLNGDENLSIEDVVLMQNYLLSIIKEFPISK